MSQKIPIPVLRYLERLQRSVCSATGWELLDWGSLSRDEMLDRFLVYRGIDTGGPEAAMIQHDFAPALDEALSLKRPSRFEDPFNYWILHGLVTEIEAATTPLGIRLRSAPIFGTLRSGNVNAMVLEIPSSKHKLVLVETELFLYAHLLAKAVAAAIPIIASDGTIASFSFNPDRIRRNLANDPTPSHRFLGLILAYAMLGRPGDSDPYLLYGAQAEMTNRLCHAMELFVVGHEYGHLARGHLGATSKIPRTIAGVPIKEILYNWKQEFEADAAGLELSLAAAAVSQTALPIAYSGTELFFYSCEVLDWALALVRTGQPSEVPSATHPPPRMRREATRDLVLNSVDSQTAEDILCVATSLDAVMAAFMEVARPHLVGIHQSGELPARSWLVA